MAHEKRLRPEPVRHAPSVDGHWATIARALDAVEQRWMPHLAGRLTRAQIGLGCPLGDLDLRHSDRDWRVGHPALAAWQAGFAKRPPMLATVPPAS